MRFYPLPRSVLPVMVGVGVLISVWLAWGTLRHSEDVWAPGHLSRYHADIQACTRCHEPFRGAIPSKCLACHSNRMFLVMAVPHVVEFHRTVIRDGRSCLECHTEHRGVLAQITLGSLRNPHGEFIFRATGTSSCTDCHTFASEGNARLLDNPIVLDLLEAGEGAHKPGHFSDCLRCHSW